MYSVPHKTEIKMREQKNFHMSPRNFLSKKKMNNYQKCIYMFTLLLTLS